jgi:hypothetical protein
MRRYMVRKLGEREMESGLRSIRQGGSSLESGEKSMTAREAA